MQKIGFTGGCKSKAVAWAVKALREGGEMSFAKDKRKGSCVLVLLHADLEDNQLSLTCGKGSLGLVVKNMLKNKRNEAREQSASDSEESRSLEAFKEGLDQCLLE